MPYVSLSQFRSCEKQIRHTRNFLGGMPVKDTGRGSRRRWRESPDLDCADTCEREAKKNWVERSSDCSAAMRESWLGQWGVPKRKWPVRRVLPSSKNSPALAHPLRLVTGWEQPRGSVASAWALTHIWRCNSWRLWGHRAPRRRFSLQGSIPWLPPLSSPKFYFIL